MKVKNSNNFRFHCYAGLRQIDPYILRIIRETKANRGEDVIDQSHHRVEYADDLAIVVDNAREFKEDEVTSESK